jgi:hypothetical protein
MFCADRAAIGIVDVRAGDRVELRSPAEIVATLDAHGCLGGVPFMPEMLSYFGRPFTVGGQVGRACDTIHYSGVRRLRDTVVLDEVRCDGTGHAGCQAQCRVYWKEAWLRPASSGSTANERPNAADFEELERRAACGVYGETSTADQPIYRCQATELLRAGEPVGWWSLRSLVSEVTGGNVSVWAFLKGMIRVVIEEIGRRLGLVSNQPFRTREMTGRNETPPPPVGLRPGQLVQIRPRGEIAPTLDTGGKARGLWFDREMKVYCGQTARVKTKVERFIDEESGRLVNLASDCYILDGVVCQSYRSPGRWFCSRAIYPWWREAWLQPIEGPDESPAGEG